MKRIFIKKQSKFFLVKLGGNVQMKIKWLKEIKTDMNKLKD